MAPRRPGHVLSAVEFDVVWRGLGLGAPPIVLRLPSPGRTHTQRRSIEAQVWAALRERGLGPDSPLARLLRLLAAPSLRVDVRAWGSSTCRAAVAGRYDAAVLAHRRGDAVVLQPCASVPGAVTALLACGRPGSGRAACVPRAELEAALRHPSGAGLRADLVGRGVDPVEAGLVARMLHGTQRRAQVTAAVADRWGVLRRRGELIEVLDGPGGRHVMTRSPGGGWVTVAPVDDRRLRHRVAAALDEGQSRSPCRISCRPASVIEPDSEG